MKKQLAVSQIIGFIFTGIAGVLLHFLFDWANQSVLAAPFSAVNESIWEHIKLLFFPMFAFALAESRYSESKNFWCVKLISIVSALVLTPVLYYTINGAFGPTPDWVNIAIFFVAVAIGYIIEYVLFRNNSIECNSPQTPFVVLWLIVLVFAWFTFFPPQISLFRDPITGTYGI